MALRLILLSNSSQVFSDRLTGRLVIHLTMNGGRIARVAVRSVIVQSRPVNLRLLLKTNLRVSHTEMDIKV